MPTRVLLLRHAESANPRIFHGAESDVDLSALGQRQAQAVAPLLAACAPDALVSSAMLRARRTAEPIARACRLPLLVEPDLHERRVGALGGTPTGLRDGAWPDTLRRWLAGDTGFAPPGAESYDAIRARVLPVWERLTTEWAGRTLVIVAHGVVCRVLLLELLPGHGAGGWHRLGPMANVGISEVVRGAGEPWQALRLNEVPPASAVRLDEEEGGAKKFGK
jgi:probable phosphoglycerate mutase